MTKMGEVSNMLVFTESDREPIYEPRSLRRCIGEPIAASHALHFEYDIEDPFERTTTERIVRDTDLDLVEQLHQ